VTIKKKKENTEKGVPKEPHDLKYSASGEGIIFASGEPSLPGLAREVHFRKNSSTDGLRCNLSGEISRTQFEQKVERRKKTPPSLDVSI